MKKSRKFVRFVLEDQRRNIEVIVELTGLVCGMQRTVFSTTTMSRLMQPYQFFSSCKKKTSITPLPHAPYSTDLLPCNFFLFVQMKRDMKGHRFNDVEEVEIKTRRKLVAIQIEELEQCFQKWNCQLDKCIKLNGEYIEEC